MHVLQLTVVVVLVLGAGVFAAWRLSPAAMKLRVLDLLARKVGAMKWVTRLRHGAVARLEGGCGSCPSHPTSMRNSRGR